MKRLVCLTALSLTLLWSACFPSAEDVLADVGLFPCASGDLCPSNYLCVKPHGCMPCVAKPYTTTGFGACVSDADTAAILAYVPYPAPFTNALTHPGCWAPVLFSPLLGCTRTCQSDSECGEDRRCVRDNGTAGSGAYSSRKDRPYVCARSCATASACGQGSDCTDGQECKFAETVAGTSGSASSMVPVCQYNSAPTGGVCLPSMAVGGCNTGLSCVFTSKDATSGTCSSQCFSQ